VDEWISLHGDEPDTTQGPHLISVDELRAAGALDVPASWRKSLGKVEEYLLPGFDDDEDTEPAHATNSDNVA
jgi:hypothetical protein